MKPMALLQRAAASAASIELRRWTCPTRSAGATSRLHVLGDGELREARRHAAPRRRGPPRVDVPALWRVRRARAGGAGGSVRGALRCPGPTHHGGASAGVGISVSRSNRPEQEPSLRPSPKRGVPSQLEAPLNRGAAYSSADLETNSRTYRPRDRRSEMRRPERMPQLDRRWSDLIMSDASGSFHGASCRKARRK
jgi:hypothetical protein